MIGDKSTIDTFTNPSIAASMVPAMIFTYVLNNETGESHFPFVSDYSQDMFGLPASDIVNDPECFMNRVHPDDVNLFTASVLESMTNLTTCDLKLHMITTTGKVIHIHGRSSPHNRTITNIDGSTAKFTIWHGVLIDITQKQQIEGEKLQNFKNEELGLNRNQSCIGMNERGIFTEWNETMTELAGMDHVMGKPFMSVVTDLYKQKVDATEKSTINPAPKNQENRTFSNKNFTFMSKSGDKVHVSATVSLGKTQVNNYWEFFFSPDTTALQKAEKDKKNALQFLDSDKNLTGWLSHEIRNPLSIALEASYALNDIFKKKDFNKTTGTDLPDNFTEICDENGSYHVDLILRSILFAVDLLTNMLDLNKCVEGKIVLRPTLCFVREDVVKPVLEMMGAWNYSSVGKNRVPIYVDCETDVQIYVDKLRLKQVLINLISNAFKFTKEGFIRITICKKKNLDLNDGETKSSIVISVSDTGPGIDEKNRDKIFSKWEQLGSTSAGAGIGLCLSRLLVNAMGGEINLNPEYASGMKGNPGAEFVVRLPMNTLLVSDHEGNAMHSVPAYRAVSQAVLASRSSKQMPFEVERNISDEVPTLNKLNGDDGCFIGKFRILIVDDDRISRKMLRRRFSRLFPHGVLDEAQSGEQCLEYITIHKKFYDIIFMDQNMGAINGDETIKKLRESNVDSLIIGISANKIEGLHITAGADGFYQKPIPPDGILLQRFATQLPPPGNWRVLILDSIKSNTYFTQKELQQVSSAHFTTVEESEGRWSMTPCFDSEKAMSLIANQWFDLILLDHNLQNLSTDVCLGAYAREYGMNKDAIIVLCSSLCRKGINEKKSFNLFWSKPLPSVEIIRQNLCQELLKSRSFVKDMDKPC
eukprot:CAMPEP_0113306642 /NCGR_PEP_ID=MMETSP0010_2-20120614/5814_1 /TAXON_ID=216773 ORGANISM="Corethron hystrix, Strain 308" /NCGR_SAMPLE_ID=MMETSP0010_2 /ASSEMBLY_ACC=CAM_ASM_000155 /LENGTH=871 /DNA_ID=CAMNT_0000161355 /DNA_START=104 /DNA_END=2720 /DNA_ORIENTATION=- /assembly_acc=CAM_ASM_000155